jgi:crotonyl-CoA carboxylase/reductase
MFSNSQRIWGYETPDGSFAQFTRVQARQLLPKPQHLSWEEASCYTLTLATAYRMRFGHRPHVLSAGQNVLVWGASGGLGSMAIQLAATTGANAIGIISEDDKADFVMQLGAKGVINRKKFTCWGQMPAVGTPEYNDWLKGAREFGKAIDPLRHKLMVDCIVSENLADDARQQRGVFAWPHLQEQIGVLRQLSAARIDDVDVFLAKRF